ncbi:hypothetical protein AVEN_152790-1 [Araneus ventricosus]|uniref:Uncharacterized protein n=1 Tax=Araneus ventricosus TaxID=182803 RepID=A0A4Y2G0Z0_ARAVE|nr:hypothetical protein AVEN_152790-1 [Araneus ventricosus]
MSEKKDRKNKRGPLPLPAVVSGNHVRKASVGLLSDGQKDLHLGVLLLEGHRPVEAVQIVDGPREHEVVPDFRVSHYQVGAEGGIDVLRLESSSVILFDFVVTNYMLRSRFLLCKR